MTKFITMLLFLGLTGCSFAQRSTSPPDGPQTDHTDGILQSIHNASAVTAGDDLRLTRLHHEQPIELLFTTCQGLGIDRQDNQLWILPISAAHAQISANSYLWVLPLDPTSNDHAWHIELHGGDAAATKTETGLKVLVNEDSVTLRKLQARPHRAVAAEAARSNYFTDERYDMDYVYYVDGKNAHGAEQYYEYPNVFAAVLISKFLGLTLTSGVDVSVAPHLNSFGTVEFRIPEYAVRSPTAKIVSC